MGAHPYWYTVKYEGDVEVALHKLREREFRAGRYNPVMPFIRFPIDLNAPSPGVQHESIEEAMVEADADGTRSILDILGIGEQADFCTAGPLSDEVLEDLYGTTQPTREQVEANLEFLEEVERGQAVYILLYHDGKPDEVMFAGYSFD
ncbi:MAG: hypothetical protein U0840_02635 [Gemmataceae bacterium]